MIASHRLFLIAGLAGVAASASLAFSGRELARPAAPTPRTVVKHGVVEKVSLDCGQGKGAVITHRTLSDEWCVAPRACFVAFEAAAAVACRSAL